MNRSLQVKAVMVLILVLGWVLMYGRPALMRHLSPPEPPPPERPFWPGTWVNGTAMVRINNDGTGDICLDGEWVSGFRCRVQPEGVTFKTSVKGVPWSLWMTRDGDYARLAGVQDQKPAPALVVISPHSKREEEEGREAAKQQRNADAKRRIVPTDFGNFRRS